MELTTRDEVLNVIVSAQNKLEQARALQEGLDLVLLGGCNDVRLLSFRVIKEVSTQGGEISVWFGTGGKWHLELLLAPTSSPSMYFGREFRVWILQKEHLGL